MWQSAGGWCMNLTTDDADFKRDMYNPSGIQLDAY